MNTSDEVIAIARNARSFQRQLMIAKLEAELLSTAAGENQLEWREGWNARAKALIDWREGWNARAKALIDWLRAEDIPVHDQFDTTDGG